MKTKEDTMELNMCYITYTLIWVISLLVSTVAIGLLVSWGEWRNDELDKKE